MDAFTFIRLVTKSFLMPPGIFFFVLLLCLLLLNWRPKIARTIGLITLFTFYAFCTPKLVEILAKPLENYATLSLPNASQADAIVVLAGGRERQPEQWGGDYTAAVAMQRVHYGAELAKKLSLPMLASGGRLYPEEASEAELMAKAWREDYELNNVFTEDNSKTTWENAKYSALWLKQRGYSKVVLVTHAWHMQRSVWSYQQFGLEVIPAPVAGYRWQQRRPLSGLLPDGRALMQNTQLVNEYIGVMLYRFIYKPMVK